MSYNDVIFSEGQKFSATMPKAKNQSRRVYSLVVGDCRRSVIIIQ